ncbi:TPA: hypothetical protein ACGCA2_003206 [Citrobacter youngae]
MTALNKQAHQTENERMAQSLAERNGEPVEGLRQRISELEEIATDYGMKFQKAQDALKHQSILHKSQLEAAERRIAELERSETQLIDERDNAESALNDAYKAVMGQAPEWSNWFSFADAIDEIELACGLWRNQTEDVLQFRARIAELEARKFKVEMPESFYPDGDIDAPLAVDELEIIAAIVDAGGKPVAFCKRCDREIDLTYRPDGSHYCHTPVAGIGVRGNEHG